MYKETNKNPRPYDTPYIICATQYENTLLPVKLNN